MGVSSFGSAERDERLLEVNSKQSPGIDDAHQHERWFEPARTRKTK